LEHTRVLLLEMPTMLADLLKGIVRADDQIEIVAELTDASDLIEVSDRANADLVIVSLNDNDSELPEPCRALLSARPRMRVLGLAEHGRHGFLWELRPHRMALGEISPSTLLPAIRSRQAPAEGPLPDGPSAVVPRWKL
jgi:DNA-binding NarL/FixJ family response regulator